MRQTQLNPGVLNSQPSSRRRLRFSGTISSSAVTNITRACVLSLLNFNASNAASTTHVLIPMISAARLISVDVWTPQQTNSNSATPLPGISFEWATDLGKPTKKTRMTLSSIASKFTERPPRNSRAADWSVAGSLAATLAEVLFVLSVEDSALAGGNSTIPVVIDVALEYITVDESASTLTFTTSNESLPVGLSGLWLDNLTTSGALPTSSTLAPVGIPLPFLFSQLSALVRVG